MARAGKPAPPSPKDAFDAADGRLESGMTTTRVRSLAKELREASRYDAETAAALLAEAARRGGREEMLLATYVAQAFRKKLGATHGAALQAMAEALPDEETADELAEHLLGPLAAEQEAFARRLDAMASCPAMLERRLAAASARHLAFRTARPLLARLAKDDEPAVRSVAAASLRALATAHGPEVAAFLREETKLPSDVVREAAAGLPADLALALSARRAGVPTKPARGKPKEDEKETAAQRKQREAAERALREAEAALAEARKRHEAALQRVAKAEGAMREARERLEREREEEHAAHEALRAAQKRHRDADRRAA